MIPLTKLCSVEGCNKIAHARGWCQTHYVRWKRLGTVTLTPYVTPPCSVDECERKSYSNGMCSRHYNMHRLYGRTEYAARPLVERFATNYIPDEQGCWIWQHKPGKNGYGLISVNNKGQYAHRISYELHVGAIPEGLTIDHLCRVRLCVNPLHLEPVTRAENTRRELIHRYPTKKAS